MIKINESAPVKTRKHILINASRENVWNVLTNIDQWPAWNTDIKAANINGELKPQTSFDWKSGGSTIHSILHTVEPYDKFGWTGKAFGGYAVHNWILRDVHGKTEVFVEESMEGFLVKLLKGMMQKTLDKGMESWLQQLKIACEK